MTTIATQTDFIGTNLKLSNEHKGYYLAAYPKDILGNSHTDRYKSKEEAIVMLEKLYKCGIKCGGIVYEKYNNPKNDGVYSIRLGSIPKLPAKKYIWKDNSCWVVLYE